MLHCFKYWLCCCVRSGLTILFTFPELITLSVLMQQCNMSCSFSPLLMTVSSIRPRKYTSRSALLTTQRNLPHWMATECCSVLSDTLSSNTLSPWHSTGKHFKVHCSHMMSETAREAQKPQSNCQIQ